MTCAHLLRETIDARSPYGSCWSPPHIKMPLAARRIVVMIVRFLNIYGTLVVLHTLVVANIGPLNRSVHRRSYSQDEPVSTFDQTFATDSGVLLHILLLERGVRPCILVLCALMRPLQGIKASLAASGHHKWHFVCSQHLTIFADFCCIPMRCFAVLRPLVWPLQSSQASLDRRSDPATRQSQTWCRRLHSTPVNVWAV